MNSNIVAFSKGIRGDSRVYGQASFFTLNKISDWEQGVPYNTQISGEGISLNKTEKYALARNIGLDDIESIPEVADFAVGKFGVLYLLDVDGSIWIYDYVNKQCDLFLASGHGLFTSNADIAYAGNKIILADPYSESKIIVFSLLNGQVLWSMGELGDNGITPLGLAVDQRKNLYVVTQLDSADEPEDAGEIPRNTRLGILKITLSGEAVGIFRHEHLHAARTASLWELRNNLYITVAGDGSVYLLESNSGNVFIFSADGSLRGHFVAPSPVKGGGLAVDSLNNIYMGDRHSISSDAEDDRFLLQFSPAGELLEKVSGFRGITEKIYIDDKDRIYIRGGENRSIVVLELKAKIQEADLWGLPRGIYFLHSLDSTVTEMVWHRLVLDVDVPEGTQIKVSYFASDHKTLLIDGKYIDFDQYIKDDSLPLAVRLKNTEHFWSDTLINPGDSLLHGARGRYLRLKIDFIGSERNTPLLRKMRVYYPRMSYLSFLPAIYQEDQKSRDFLERFLSLFETFISGMEEGIDNISRFFDVDSVSGQFVKWLGSWVAVTVDDSWSEEQLRQLIKKSPELYRKRGTRQAIIDIIEIYTGEKPFVVEYFQFKHSRDNPELKVLAARLYGEDPYSFCVLVKHEHVATEQRRMTVQKIINDEKPAFTEARLVVLQPWIYVDMHSYLGINTYLSELSLLRLDQQSTIPYSTVVVDVEMESRMGIHTRVELDSEVKF